MLNLSLLSLPARVYAHVFDDVITLHKAGQTAAVDIVVEDIERCMRRAARLAAEHRAPSAPQSGDAHCERPSDAASSLIGSQCSDGDASTSIEG